MLSNLRTKKDQMASALNMSNSRNRDSLLGPDAKPADAMSRTVGLDNQGIVGLQRQIMKGKLLLLDDVFLNNCILAFHCIIYMLCLSAEEVKSLSVNFFEIRAR